MVAPKREKMACQRSMTQKREREKGVTMSQKKRDRDDSREKTITSRSLQLHILIEIAWLVSPWVLSLSLQYMECKYALFLSYLELHKGFLAVGKTEGKNCHGKEDTSWVPWESHPWNFAKFSKNLSKSISRWIADLWTSKYYSMHRSNSQQPKAGR